MRICGQNSESNFLLPVALGAGSALAVAAALHLVAKAHRLVTIGASLGTFTAVTYLASRGGERPLERPTPPLPPTPTLKERLEALHMPQEILERVGDESLEELSLEIVKHHTGLERPGSFRGTFDGKPIHLVKLTLDDLSSLDALDAAIERDTAGFVEYGQRWGNACWVKRSELEGLKLREKLEDRELDDIPLPANYDPSNEAHRKEVSWKIAATFANVVGHTVEVTEDGQTEQVDLWRLYKDICFSEEQLRGELTNEMIEAAIQDVQLPDDRNPVETWRNKLSRALQIGDETKAVIMWAEGDLDSPDTRQEISNAVIRGICGVEERKPKRLTIAGKEYEGWNAPLLDSVLFTKEELLGGYNRCTETLAKMWIPFTENRETIYVIEGGENLCFAEEGEEHYLRAADALAAVQAVFPEHEISELHYVSFSRAKQNLSASVVCAEAPGCNQHRVGDLNARPWKERLAEQLAGLGIDLDLNSFGDHLFAEPVRQALSKAILKKHLGLQEQIKIVSLGGYQQWSGNTLPPVVFTAEELLSLSQTTLDDRLAACIKLEREGQPAVWLGPGVLRADQEDQVTVDDFRTKHLLSVLGKAGVRIPKYPQQDTMEQRLTSLLGHKDNRVEGALCDEVGQLLFGLEQPTKKRIIRGDIEYPLFSKDSGCPRLCTAEDLANLTEESLEELRKPTASVNIHFQLPTATRHYLMRARDVQELLGDMGLGNGAVTGGEITITGDKGNYAWSGNVELNGETQTITNSQGPRSWSLKLN